MTSNTPISNFHVGQRVSFGSLIGIVRYIGPVDGTSKEEEWLGVEWDDTSRGKHDGTYKGKRYFTCLSKSPTAASFVRSKKAASPQSFVEAVHQKYATEIPSQSLAVPLNKQIRISGKIVEEVGFDKIRKQQSQLHELTIVIVDGHRINCAEKLGKTIRDVCPKIQQLDISRNLFEAYEEIVRICGELDHLFSLRINGNRFSLPKFNLKTRTELDGIISLEMDDILLPWDELAKIANEYSSLKTLTASSNTFKSIPCALETENLRSLTMEYNNFASLSALAPLASLKSLETLHLKGNEIFSINSVDSEHSSEFPPVFGQNLHYLDLSSNKIGSWDFVDNMAAAFPGLIALRLAHNPIYTDNIGPDSQFSSDHDVSNWIIARLKTLKTINFSSITDAQREDAEVFYLSQIGKEIAKADDGDVGLHQVIAKHKRYYELCTIHGAPAITKESDLPAGFVEARLIKFEFYVPPRSEGMESNTKIRDIPNTFDVYRVKGLVSKMFDFPPLKTRLIWETGLWDPVAGYEEEEEGSDDEWDARVIDTLKDGGMRKGKFQKREVEIKNSTAPISNYVDGKEAKIRIEVV